MKLISAAVRTLRLPLAHPLRTSRGLLRERHSFILDLSAASGARGAGEAGPAYWLGDESLELTRASLERVAKAVEKKPDACELRASMLERSASLTPAAACALDTALLALTACERGVAVASLLGARELESIPVCALLAANEPDELQSEAADAVRAGYRCLKIKVGGDALDGDVSRVEAVRQAVGPAVAIRLDANRGWPLKRARAAISRLDGLGIEFLEEPLKDPTPEAFAKLAAAGSIPLALDESVTRVEDLARFIEKRVAEVLVLKAARLGGLTPAMQLAQFGCEAGMKVVVTDSIESPLGMSAAIHLAAALPPPRPAIGLGGAIVLAKPALGDTAFRPSPLVRPAKVGLAVACEASLASGRSFEQG